MKDCRTEGTYAPGILPFSGWLKHGLRGTEVSNLNIQDYTAEGVQVAGAKWGSDGLVPLCADARNSLDSYLGWCLRQEFDMSASGPLFKSQSNRNYGQRMSYRAIYNLVKRPSGNL